MSTLLAAARRSWRSPSTRWFLIAIVVAFLLRLAWALWAAQAPMNDHSDPGRFYVMAERFSRLDTEQINGHTTGFTAPGWAFVLTPFAYVSRKTDWFSLALAAALLNVVWGTVTVGATGLLAQQWFGRATRNPAAWLVALSPGYVYYTSTLLSETFFTMLIVLLLLAGTWLVTREDHARPRTAALLLLGAATGVAILVRFPAALLLLAPALSLRVVAGSWRGALRTTAWLVVGAVVVLVPWTVRNAVQVGVVTPTATNSGAYLCSGHHDGADGSVPVDGPPECFTYSPFDPDHVDEARWYRETTRSAVGYAVTHPVETVRNGGWKLWDAMSTDRDAFDSAQDYGRKPLVGERVANLLHGLANIWHWGVLTLAVAALVLMRTARRATPLWGFCAANLAIVVGGVGLTRFHTPFMAIVAAFAALALVAMARGARSIDLEALGDEDEDEDEPIVDDGREVVPAGA